MTVVKELDLVVAGHICLDLAPKFAPEHSFDEVFVPGKLSEIGIAHFSTGGVVANTGLAGERFGLKTALMAKVGDDYFGAVIKGLLNKEHRNIALCQEAGLSTSYTLALNLPGEDRVFLHHPGANNFFYATDLDYELVRNARIFHFGYPPLMASLYQNDGQELLKIFSKAKEMGAITSLDMAMPDANAPSGQVDWHTILRRIGPYVDVFLPSYEELFLMLERDEYLARRKTPLTGDFDEELDIQLIRDFAQRLQEYGMGFVVVKAGKNGLYLRNPDSKRLKSIKGLNLSQTTSNREYWAQAYKSQDFVSSTGAGDCAVAGFLAALCRSFSPEDCLLAAAVAGYQNLRAVDAISGLGSWAELLEDLKNPAAEYLQLDLSGHGFKRIKEGFWAADLG